MIISLRYAMFELAYRLIGIYKTLNCTKAIVVDPKKLSFDPTQAIRAPQPAIPHSVGPPIQSRDRTAQSAVHRPSPLTIDQNNLVPPDCASSSRAMPPPASATVPRSPSTSGRPVAATFTVPSAPPKSPRRVVPSQSPGTSCEAALRSSPGQSRAQVPRSPSANVGTTRPITQAPSLQPEASASNASRRLDLAAARSGSVFVRASSPPRSMLPPVNAVPARSHPSPSRIGPRPQRDGAGGKATSPMLSSPSSSSSSSPSASPAIDSSAAAVPVQERFVGPLHPPEAAPTPIPNFPPDRPSRTPSPLSNLL